MTVTRCRIYERADLQIRATLDLRVVDADAHARAVDAIGSARTDSEVRNGRDGPSAVSALRVERKDGWGAKVRTARYLAARNRYVARSGAKC